MKFSKIVTAMMAAVLTLSMPITASAATWEDVNDHDKLSQAFEDTEAEVYIKLSGDISNTSGGTLAAGAGQSYTIDGEDYTLIDIQLGGSGSVMIYADLAGSAGSDESDDTSDGASKDTNNDTSDAQTGTNTPKTGDTGLIMLTVCSL